ncbi:Fe3+/spermidine/putrescine ABC transporter ATP-binding protein [Devosia sp. Leaf420]|uniref:ABC transporter ATP-binding protein n=1 Tax=Devosia sp. Leaf420 TaxID=1736374 RepID=UPI000715F427|nr:Fe3+/spermidine/putrescine ABC transporter ATP-binding protein [Devosia sp. Leaf420]
MTDQALAVDQQAMETQPQGLVVNSLTHRYGTALAIDRITFDVRPGEVVALLGPSGCGKSTVLRSIAGLIKPQEGTITMGAQRLDTMPARTRGIGMVFQNYALFPHLTVEENVGYPLTCQGLPRSERRQRVAELLTLVRLDTMARRLPREQSGGQQQRVAVARALAARPNLLLLDEPFGALDRALRFDLQVEMLRLQRSLGITTLIVTHDQEEAQSLAGRLVLMNKGRVEQIDTPTAVYDAPKSLFVNSFIGQANQLPGIIQSAGADHSIVRLAVGQKIKVPRQVEFVVDAPVVVTCRPEDVTLVSGANATTLPARVSVAIALGPTLVHELTLADGTEIRASQMRDQSMRPGKPGEAVFLSIDTARCHIFPAPAGSSLSSSPSH